MDTAEVNSWQWWKTWVIKLRLRECVGELLSEVILNTTYPGVTYKCVIAGITLPGWFQILNIGRNALTHCRQKCASNCKTLRPGWNAIRHMPGRKKIFSWYQRQTSTWLFAYANMCSDSHVIESCRGACHGFYPWRLISTVTWMARSPMRLTHSG